MLSTGPDTGAGLTQYNEQGGLDADFGPFVGGGPEASAKETEEVDDDGDQGDTVETQSENWV